MRHERHKKNNCERHRSVPGPRVIPDFPLGPAFLTNSGAPALQELVRKSVRVRAASRNMASQAHDKIEVTESMPHIPHMFISSPRVASSRDNNPGNDDGEVNASAVRLIERKKPDSSMQRHAAAVKQDELLLPTMEERQQGASVIISLKSREAMRELTSRPASANKRMIEVKRDDEGMDGMVMTMEQRKKSARLDAPTCIANQKEIKVKAYTIMDTTHQILRFSTSPSVAVSIPVDVAHNNNNMANDDHALSGSVCEQCPHFPAACAVVKQKATLRLKQEEPQPDSNQATSVETSNNDCSEGFQSGWQVEETNFISLNGMNSQRQQLQSNDDSCEDDRLDEDTDEIWNATKSCLKPDTSFQSRGAMKQAENSAVAEDRCEKCDLVPHPSLIQSCVCVNCKTVTANVNLLWYSQQRKIYSQQHGLVTLVGST
jgi:hypothetical protein